MTSGYWKEMFLQQSWIQFRKRTENVHSCPGWKMRWAAYWLPRDEQSSYLLPSCNTPDSASEVCTIFLMYWIRCVNWGKTFSVTLHDCNWWTFTNNDLPTIRFTNNVIGGVNGGIVRVWCLQTFNDQGSQRYHKMRSTLAQWLFSDFFFNQWNWWRLSAMEEPLE